MCWPNLMIPRNFHQSFRAQSQNMEKSTKQHWFHLISLGFTWFPRQRASLGQVRWWSSGYRFPPATAGRPVKIQFPASATLVVARMVQKCKTSWILPSPFLCNVKNLKISLESKRFSYGFPASFDRGLQLHRGRVHRVHRPRSGLGFVVMNLGVFSVDQSTVAPNLTISIGSIGSFGLPGAKGKKP